MELAQEPAGVSGRNKNLRMECEVFLKRNTDRSAEKRRLDVNRETCREDKKATHWWIPQKPLQYV